MPTFAELPDGRHPARRRPRVGRQAPGGRSQAAHHPLRHDRAIRDLHHRPERPDHLPAPLHGSEDPDRRDQAPADHHPRPVRRPLRRDPHPRAAAAGRDRRRDRAALGRAHRTPQDGDLDLDTGVITVSRVAGELAAKFNPDGQRFFVKQYPKDTEWRAVTLSEHMFDQLADYARGMQPDDLLFKAPDQSEPAAATDPNPAGPGHPRADRTQRAGPAVPARHHQRLRPRTMPLPTLQERLRRLPRHDAPPAKTTPANPDDSTPTATSPAPGSAAKSGTPPSPQPDSPSRSGSTTSATPTPPGCSPAEPTSKSSKNAWATPRSPPPQKYLHTLPNADQAAVTALNTIRKRTN